MTIKMSAVALLSVAALSVSASARDQIKIVGSSTVYPFTSYVAEEFKAVTGNPTPVVESTGTGGGMKLFCAGDGLDTPDFTNASRPIKADEFEICVKNGVTDITGMMVGFDGIAIAQSKINGEVALSKEHLFLALADEVPGKDGKLMKNPYKTWNEIDAKLPNRKITVYGPPTTSGTRDSFDEMVMEAASKKFDAYGDKKGKYKAIRQDGAFVPAGENDNLIVQKLTKDTAAFGIFGYSFLEENGDKINGATVDGVAPTSENISSGKYPISRSLYIYAKNSHRASVKGMDEFFKLYVDDKMVGQKGVLKTIGLVPMTAEELKKVQAAVLAKTKLTEEMVKKHTILP
ncbi:phosphate ABC transporter substrate-binding protein, PhoT family [Sulfurospirillum barnesii SES-3]|uniref:Phosphate ABC transporter substrate-binding protein, PhoT family n=2 Tax=Sulfurospirillum barnesii TaxID=44674 RepID=I3XZ60_SULBS|nr:PstS family phosphate ABC transporter substrate-binding protein [Sulfurospirillum barnesii]AFL69234.1 phosphate ABC transporter substrate-binding protein, PhoT family [Sulfurospirillum barnesii SES-3]